MQIKTHTTTHPKVPGANKDTHTNTSHTTSHPKVPGAHNSRRAYHAESVLSDALAGLGVARLVEVAEEEQEEEAVHRDPVHEHVRVLARRPEQHLQLVAEDQHELDLGIRRGWVKKGMSM